MAYCPWGQLAATALGPAFRPTAPPTVASRPSRIWWELLTKLPRRPSDEARGAGRSRSAKYELEAGPVSGAPGDPAGAARGPDGCCWDRGPGCSPTLRHCRATARSLPPRLSALPPGPGIDLAPSGATRRRRDARAAGPAQFTSARPPTARCSACPVSTTPSQHHSPSPRPRAVMSSGSSGRHPPQLRRRPRSLRSGSYWRSAAARPGARTPGDGAAVRERGRSGRDPMSPPASSLRNRSPRCCTLIRMAHRQRR